MSYRLIAICDRCGRQTEIKQLPDSRTTWEHEIGLEGWQSFDEDDICRPCLLLEEDELAAARELRALR